MNLRDDEILRALDLSDVCDGLFAGVNREFADIFGAMPIGPRARASHEAPSGLRHSASPAIAKEKK